MRSEDEVTSDAFLSKWLKARRWDSQHAFESIEKHATWRADFVPNGFIDEVTGGHKVKIVLTALCLISKNFTVGSLHME